MVKILLHYKQLIVFIIGGGLSALIDLICTWILIELDVWYIASVSVGFISGLLFNFIFHAKVTFDSHISKSNIIRYGLIVVLNYFVMLAIIIILQDFLGVSVLIGKIISLPIIALSGYFWGKYWIFYDYSSLEKID